MTRKQVASVLVDKLAATSVKRTSKVPLDETEVEFDDDQIDEALTDARDEAHLDARRATQGKYEMREELTMRKNPLNKGIIMKNADGIGTVTTAMVEARARELALINGHGSSEPTEADYRQAKRELTGDSEIEAQEKTLESLPESERWDPVPGSSGHQAAESLGEDEDAEGRSESAQMFEEGIIEAEHDQMLRAAEAEEQSESE